MFALLGSPGIRSQLRPLQWIFNNHHYHHPSQPKNNNCNKMSRRPLKMGDKDDCIGHRREEDEPRGSPRRGGC